MLLALAPGGIGASLRAAGGEVDADSKASLQLLYIEDRYGLDDHSVVQYFRWLGRISPVKFGERAMRNYAGDLEEPPRHRGGRDLLEPGGRAPPHRGHRRG